MNNTHEIEKLKVDINGDLDRDQERIIRETIPEVLEECFDRFDIEDKTIVFDKIDLNLGSIKSQNLKEEIRVRLTYLINTEFEKIFNNKDIYELIEENAFKSSFEIFIHYLKTGYSKDDQTNLSLLFENLLIFDYQILNEIVEQAKLSTTIRDRLFYQVKFEVQEAYWSKTYPFAYSQIQKINHRLLQDFGEVFSKAQDISGLQGVLKRQLFDFMMDPLPSEEIGMVYIEQLKRHVNRFMPFEQSLEKSPFRYFEELANAYKRNKTIDIEILELGNINNIVSYIDQGKQVKFIGNRDLHGVSGRLSNEEIIILANKIILNPKAASYQAQIKRLITLFSSSQLELFFENLQKKEDYRTSSAISEFRYLKKVTSDLFSENVYQIGATFISSYMANAYDDNLKKDEILSQYIAIIAAKKSLSEEEVTSRLIEKVDASFHKEAIALKRKLKGAEQTKEETKGAKVITKDLMGTYLHFLRSGIWILIDKTPVQILEQLLKESRDQLVLQLNRHLDNQVIWLRLVYQHPIELLEKVFEEVFKDDKDLDVLLNQMSQVKSITNRTQVQRQLLEAFVMLKHEIRNGSDEQFENEFIQRTNKILSNSKPQEPTNELLITTAHINSQLHQYFIEESIQDIEEGAKSKLIDTFHSQTHIIFRYLIDESIAEEKWIKLFKKIENDELLQLIQAIAKYATKSQWLRTLTSLLHDKTLTLILSPKQLYQSIILLPRGQENQLKMLVTKAWDKTKKQHPEQAKELLKQKHVSLFIRQANGLAIADVQLKTAISSNEISLFKKEMTASLLALNKLHVEISFEEITHLLSDILPTADSIEALKIKVIRHLYKSHPEHAKSIHTVVGKIFFKKANTSNTGIKEIEEQLFDKYALSSIGTIDSRIETSLPIEESHKTFSELVRQIIELETLEVLPYFKNTKEFEKQLVIAVKSHGTVLEVFEYADVYRLTKFINQLSKATIKVFQDVVKIKFEQSDYQNLLEEVSVLNTSENKEIELASLSYGLTQPAFGITSYLQFINERVPSLTIPVQSQEILKRQEEESPTLYVQAFIHFIKHKKHIYLPLEEDGDSIALDKVITYWLHEFITQLGREPEVKLILLNIFNRLLESKQEALFRRITQIKTDKIAYVYDVLSENITIDKKEILSSWLVLVLQNQASLDIFTIVELLAAEYGIKTAQKRVKWTTQKVEGLIDSSDESLAKLPKDLLGLGVPLNQRGHYNVFDLLVEVIKSGKFPNWTTVRSSVDLTQIFHIVAKNTPTVLQNILKQELKKIGKVDKLMQRLGTNDFLSIFKKVDAQTYSEATKVSNDLGKSHLKIGDKKTLKTYFQNSYIQARYCDLEVDVEVLIFKILQRIPDVFGLSTYEHIELLTASNTPVIKKYIQHSLRTAELPNLPLSLQQEIDSLFHLVMKKEVPWWVAQKKVTENKSIDQTIKSLIKKLLEKDPKVFIQAIEVSTASDKIYQRILPTISIQQFDRILLKLTPNFGGFIISFNLLLTKRGKEPDKTLWFLFILNYLSENLVFNVRSFMSMALDQLTTILVVDKWKLRKQLLEVTKKAIEKGEVRFQSFVDVLSRDIALPSEVIKEDEKEELPSALTIPQSLVETVIHYIRTGSLPMDSSLEINNYMSLAQLIERQIHIGINELRVEVIGVLRQEKVRMRIVRYESEHFLILITRILFPKQVRKLVDYKVTIVKLFKDKFPTVNIKTLQELFFKSLFDQVLNKNFEAVTTESLVVTFMQNARDTFKITYEAEELAHDDFPAKIIENLIENEGDTVIGEENTVERKVPKIRHFEEQSNAMVDGSVLVKNAGLVIFWPYLSRYFDMLLMLEDGKFKTPEDASRAVQLLHYLSTGLVAVPEHELLLSKVLCGVRVSTPVPLEIVLTDLEKETTEMMVKGVLQNWEKLKSSSIEALREGFLIRDAYIIEKDETWELKVEKKTLDILMENLPWAFGTIKLPWMDKRLNVEWL